MIPGDGGEFEFAIDGVVVHSKRETKTFPEPDVLKKAVVDALEA